MTTVSFKAKIERPTYYDGTPAPARIKVPALARRHCDMAAFRSHPKFGPYANSDLFPSMLARAVKAAGVGAYLNPDALPESVAVDASGFLAEVTIRL